MYLEQYSPESHATSLTGWLIGRGVAYVPDEYPEIGYVVCERGTPIAACFLRRIEGGYAQLDSLMTDPGAASEQRHAAIDLAVSQLITIAKQLKIKGIVCTTRSKEVLERALSRHGFVLLPEVVIALSLGES